MSAVRRATGLATACLATTFAVAAASPQAKRGYTATAITNGGAIVGVVRFDGSRPAPEKVTVTTKEEVCHADPIYREKVVVSENNMLRWAVVSIKGISEGKPFPDYEGEDDKSPTLDQAGCVFRPHVLVVPKGQTLTLRNSDGVLHNVHTWPKKNRSKNIAMPGPIKEMKVKFRRPERIRVSCDIHAWMEAWIVVTEHPYYAVSDKNGAFKLTDVPPGEYTLRLWHEKLGEAQQEVTVKPKAETHVEFTLRHSK